AAVQPSGQRLKPRVCCATLGGVVESLRGNERTAPDPARGRGEQTAPPLPRSGCTPQPRVAQRTLGGWALVAHAPGSPVHFFPPKIRKTVAPVRPGMLE